MYLIRTFAAFLLTGSAFFSGLFPVGRVKEGVTVDGIGIGGMPYGQAETLLREELKKRLPPLLVHAPSETLSVEKELSVTDDAARLVRKAKKGESLTLSYTRSWADMEETLRELCARNARDAVCARLSFSAKGFTYYPGMTGLACDFHTAVSDVSSALQEGKRDVFLRCFEYAPSTTEEDLRARTKLLSSASTRFDGSNTPRRHNIALACKRVSGTVLGAGESFSFNEKVGRRTTENGFETANIISGGEFVPGVGGGVCQASTTLFQAALRAGLTVTKSRAHSLAVGYAAPSLDAMVSEESDLEFFNPYDFPVYLLGSTGENSVTFCVYGMPDGRRYETESVVLKRLPPPPPKEVEGGGSLKKEKDGIVSESYLLVYDKNGELLSRTRIRKDCYAAVRGEIAVTPEMPQEFEKNPEKLQKIQANKPKSVDFP